MSQSKQDRPSYDDIVRKTVVDPDSSVRPSRDQERQAREGFRALDGDERDLHDRVVAALGNAGLTAGVTIEVTRAMVTLGGRVADAQTLRAVEEVVAQISGVDTVHNQIVVG